MVNIQYSNAIAEVLHYLKGINQTDLDKIPNKFKIWLEENASKDYVCDFDYTKPLKDLHLLKETKGIIGMICFNYWCENEEQKALFINRLNENEKAYQKELSEKYPINDIFSKRNSSDNLENTEQVAMIEYTHDKWYNKFFSLLRKILKKNK